MIFLSGTVTSAVQLQTLKSTWQQKKESGEVLSKKELKERESWTQEDWLKHDFERQAAQNREASKKTAIDNKILAGGTLTPEEEKYLEQQDPAKLQEYKQIKAEKKEYEEKLKKCKTKDEVQRLKAETMGEYAAALKKVENNPCIPASEKLKKAKELLAKTRNVQEVERKFIESSAYDKLPTEAEEAKERSEERTRKEEQALETQKEAVSDAKNDTESEENTESVVTDGNESVELSTAKETDTDDQKKQTDTKEADLVEEIEASYQRIQLSFELFQGGDENVRTESEKKTGGKVNLTV
jgi:hypothetical protein